MTRTLCSQPSQPFIPREVRRQAGELAEATGHDPHIEQLNDTRWRLTMRNERVFMTMDFRRVGPGRYRWAGSTLEVDGQPRPLAAGLREFTKLWRAPGGVPAEPLPAGRDIGDNEPAPPVKSQMRGASAPKRNLSVEVRRTTVIRT